MTQEDFTNAFILMLSGLAEWYNEKEIKLGGHFVISTIEFPTNSPSIAIIRGYYANGIKYIEEEYRDGLRDGKSLYWFENGVKWSESYFVKGLLHGKYYMWNSNGVFDSKYTYKDGVAIE